ncbi:flagellin [Selenomonas ruminantium]|uniref:Flagellin n=1 Tax=Selenomonas ruminantium TaxID=971 RepID=A0A1I3FPM9_SELRU|nr:flagellinolysin [Selenomonas ruminantium]SFI13140.1 flagellin [Selenomonas ruminantium]
MGMVIKNNMAAQNTLGTLNKNSMALSKSLQKVSSGMKINGAADDASGYAISERMRVQVRGLNQDIDNTQSAISMMKTAEGAISSTVDILKTMKEKAINAANDTNTDADRAIIQKELNQAIDQVDDNASVTFNNKILFDGSADAGTTAKQRIIKALNSEWLDSALSMAKEAYGLSFQEDETSVREMTVFFDDGSTGNNTGGTTTLAYVRHSSIGGVANKLELHVNMDVYNALAEHDVNGKAGGYPYLDRTIAHEMTHAVMAANITNFSSMPLYIKEGAADYIHGIDDQSDRKSILLGLSPSNVSDQFASQDGVTPYAMGYAFFHYLNAKSGHDGHMMTRFMKVLDEKGGSALDEAVAAASKGGFSSAAAAIAGFKQDLTDYTAAGHTTKEFLKEYCDIDFDNNFDTGSALGSKAWMGESANAEQVVIEGKSPNFWYYPGSDASVIQGLTVKWPNYTRPDGGFRFQVGTKANQNIQAQFSDIHATALGLRSDDGKNLSVETRAEAKRTMTVLDRALEKALDQQTTIGALQSRMEYTASNLTTASENVQASESTIRDANMAREMTDYTKNNVLMQAAQSMLAQANQSSSSVLSLLQ